jgi:hypothetical protein
MKRAFVLLALACAVLLFVGATAHAGSGSGPSESADSARIIDRTLRCSTRGAIGRQWIFVSALAPVRGQKSFEGSEALPSAVLETGHGDVDSLAGVYGGAPGPGYDWTFWFKDGLCQSSSARVRLSTKGLSGGTADPYGVLYRRFTPKRVLVRIQGVFRSPASLRRQRVSQTLWTRAHVQRGALAVTTTTGKPIAYLSVHEPRKARIFIAPNCEPI